MTYAMPQALRDLYAIDCWDEDVEFECHRELWADAETAVWLRDWTGNPDVDPGFLRVFGQDGSGGQTAFWLARDTEDLREQPVAFLGSEGETAVIAQGLTGFLWLLANGCGPWDASREGPPERRRTSRLRELALRHAPEAERTPGEITASARAEFPQFPGLMQAMVRYT